MNTLNANIVIIGSGPAAYTAAIYASRANLNPILFEGEAPGGQLMTTTEIENFPGFPDGIDGYRLIENMKEQAIKYGTVIYEEQITSVDFCQRPFLLVSNNHTIYSKTVIIATGATANKLSFKGSEEYWNKGISACAVCDGACPIFRNKPVAVIGGGDSAMEEAIFLTKYASQVYIIHRRNELKASKYMQQKAMSNSKIIFVYSSEVIEANGDKNNLTHILVKNNTTNEISVVPCFGIFFAIGHTPATSIFANYIDLDQNKYIITKPNSTQTNINGVFACGDVQDSKWRQAITAAGSGCIAALEVEHYLNN